MGPTTAIRIIQFYLSPTGIPYWLVWVYKTDGLQSFLFSRQINSEYINYIIPKFNATMSLILNRRNNYLNEYQNFSVDC